MSVPPLRERKEEIPALAKFFLQSYASGRLLSFNAEAEKVLFQYDYPGNIRELNNIVQNAAVLAAGEVIGPSDLRLHKPFHRHESSEVNTPPKPTTFNLLEHEIEVIRQALQSHNNNQAAAAKTLGITPQALNRRVKRYNLLSNK